MMSASSARRCFGVCVPPEEHAARYATIAVPPFCRQFGAELFQKRNLDGAFVAQARMQCLALAGTRRSISFVLPSSFQFRMGISCC
jgi:hypothetical protein